MSRGTRLTDRIWPNRLGAMMRLQRMVDERNLRTVAGEIGIGHATLMRIEHGEAFDTATLLKLLAWLLAPAVAPHKDQ